MTHSKELPIEDEFLKSAVQHGVLPEQKAIELQKLCTSSQGGKELAIRKGLIDGRKLDILESLQAPDDVVPGYRMIKVLGTGGFGVVYKATQLNMSRTVAVKTIPLSQIGDSTATQRFEQEAAIVGRLQHPNIVSAIDFGLHGKRLFLSMEYVQGIDLDRAITRRTTLDEFTCWHIVRQVAIALTEASKKGIVHRDIKPGNLMLTEAPTGYGIPANVPLVKVADFGLACFNENHRQTDRITTGNRALGTPSYVAPEQLAGDDVDERADIYSLGATAWHMLSGRPPLNGQEPMQAVMNRMSGDETWLSDMPADWSTATQDLIRDMCAHDRDERVPSHSALIVRVGEVLDHIGRQSLATLDLPTTDSSSASTAFELAEPSTAHQSDSVSDLFVSSEDTSRVAIDTRELPTPIENDNSSLPREPSRNARPFVLPTRRTIAVLASVAITLVITTLVLRPFRRSANLATEVTLTEVVGPPVFLFDGTSVDPTQDFAGNWSTDEGVELGTVLAGNGRRTFPCRSNVTEGMKYFRFSIGLLHHEAESIEFRLSSDSGGEIGRIVVSPESANFLAIDGETENPVAPPVLLRKFNADSQGYYSIVIERHVNYWEAFLEGETLGKLHNEDSSPARIQLVVTGVGNAHFEGIFVREFQGPKATEVTSK